MTRNAEFIRIDCDEDGFHLIVATDENPHEMQTRYDFVITDPEALYDHVKAVIGPWLYERDVARSMPARAIFACDPDESGGNDASDFYSIHTDIWDNREGK